MKFKLIIDNERDEELVLTSHSANEFTAKIENLVLSYNGNDELSVFTDDESTSIKIEEIECVTVIDRKTYIIGRAGSKYRTHMKLFEVESILPKYFIRINKSAIANERKIVSYKANFNGSVDAIFKCGYKDYVSRRCFAEIKRRLGI